MDPRSGTNMPHPSNRSDDPSASGPTRAEVCLDLLHRVTGAVNRSRSLNEALRTVLAETCEGLGWPMGHVFLRRGEFLVPSGVWHPEDAGRFAGFREGTAKLHLRRGEGLVGRAAEGRPVRMENVYENPDYVRRTGAAELRTGLAFPVFSGAEVVAVLEFYSTEVERIDETVHRVFESVGVQLGRVIERERADRRLAAIARASDDGLWEYDAVRDRRWTSEAFDALMGVDPGVLSTRSDWEDRIHPDDRERILASVEESFESRADSWVYEYRIVRGDGEVRWVFDRMVLDYDPEGTLLRATGAMMDVTERRRTEERLRRRTHALGERVKELACLYDVSRILLDRAGESLESVLDRVVARLPAGWQHPSITRARIRLDEVERETPGFRETPWIQRRAFGVGDATGSVEIAYLEDPREDDEEPVFLVEEERLLEAIADRLSESILRAQMEERIRRSESYYRTLVENATDIVTIVGEDGTILYESPSVERVLGYPAEERIGRNAFEFVHPEEIDGLRRSVGRSLQGGSLTDARFRIRHADGSWRHMEASGVNLLDDREIRGIVATTRDVTDRVRLEEQLAQAQKMEAVGRLAGGVAHDFNNALTVITGYARMLRDAPELAAWSEDVDEILHSAERASTLTRQLLAFGRRTVVQPETVEVDAVVAGMERMLRRLIGERVELVTELASAGTAVRIDPGHLEQLLMNLVVNAREAMPDGGRVTVSTTRVEEPDADGTDAPAIRLVVTDEGVGMDAETRAHLFEPFFTTRPDGTGLGLSIVYGIVERAGGGIEVETAPGEGSAFRVTLPAVPPDPERTGSEPEAADPDRETARGRVLLVEDEERVRRLARTLLEGAGHEVVGAPDAESALREVEAGLAFDLLVTDVVLPGASGCELAEALLDRVPGLPVLFVSGYPEDDRVREMVEAGRARFLQKPFERTALLGEVEAMLGAG